jgi:predicted alpha/beta superfamily hydrolase
MVRACTPVCVSAAAIAAFTVTCLGEAHTSADETVRFTFSYDAPSGYSVFVSGDLDRLGQGDITRAPKMIPGPGGQWILDVAVPPGQAFPYEFVLRDDDVDQWSNPSNGDVVSPTFIGKTDPIDPLRRDVSIMVATAEGHGDVTFSTPTGDAVLALRDVPGLPDYRFATLMNQPGQEPLVVRVGSDDIETPIAATLRRYGPLYTYVPDPMSLPVGRTYVFVMPTDLVRPTRTINGVTGRGYQVYLPRGYDEQPGRRYPVLYMHDGQNCFGAGGPYGSWLADTSTSDLINRGAMREIIIVAVDHGGDARAAEYVPEFGNAQWSNEQYNQFLIEELKPHIDATYRTLTGPEHTGVIGSSFGGVASVSLALDHGDVFGRVGVMSPSFWATSLDNRLMDGELDNAVLLYLDAGDVSDGATRTVQVRDAMLAAGRVLSGDLYFQIGYGQAHNEQAWSTRFPVFLESMFPITDETSTLAEYLPDPCDFDGDGIVGMIDLGVLLASYEVDAGGDLDGDLDTDIGDLGMLISRWNDVPPHPTMARGE